MYNYCITFIRKVGENMAYMIPETIRRTATAGERLVFQTLKTYLPDDYIVYFEPEINGQRPDFVIIGADLGIIVLEIKDYTRNTLYQLNKETWTIRDSLGNLQTVKNPLLQARDYAFNIKDRLETDINLIQTEGKYQFRLKFPYGYGVVFTRLNQKQVIEDGLYSIIEPQYMLTRDEIDPDHDSFSEEIFIEKLINMFHVSFRMEEPLTHEEIKAIRFHLFPEVRISAEFKEPVPYQDQLLLSLHDIKVMDLHQENLAKQIGDKNRLIRGVAGSGKTIILASRAKMLAKEHPNWKILILCYNISLSKNIETIIRNMMNEPENLFDFQMLNETGSLNERLNNIIVRNFHQWLKLDLKMNEFQLEKFLDKIDKGKAITPKYDAILIDEGQDFEPHWLKLISSCLNPETQSLLLVEDRAQEIYSRKRSFIQDTGLDFRGRSKILDINYRNTKEIVEIAWDFYQKFSLLKNKVVKGESEGVEIIPPKSTKRRGPLPGILRVENFNKEMTIIAKQIKRLHEVKKVPYSEMLILYRVKHTSNLKLAQMIIQKLKEENIPFYWITKDDDSKRGFNRDEESVKISTIYSSKGMDFQAVFIVKADLLPFHKEENKEHEVALMYIAMTRAKEYLCISYSGNSEFTEYFDEYRNKLRKVKNEKILKTIS